MAKPTKDTVCSRLNTFPDASQYGAMVTVRIGPELQEFPVHKGLLCHHSLWFKIAFNGRWAESDKKTIDLPDDDLDAFKAFFSWLYTRRLPYELQDSKTISSYKDGEEQEKARARAGSALLDLGKIYVLGDVKQIPALKNAAIDRIIETISTVWCRPSVGLVTLCYQRTPVKSSVRHLLVDCFTKTADTKGYFPSVLQIWGPVFPDFCLDVAKAMYTLREADPVAKLITRDDWLRVDRCQYHDHSDIHASEQKA